uniref:Uncharacterized protein n=1 Tax=Solanum tuberosum TaxID=4113 RepID=M1A6Q6_SOLTU
MAFFGVLLIFVKMNTTIGRMMIDWTMDPTQLQNNISEKSKIIYINEVHDTTTS